MTRPNVRYEKSDASVGAIVLFGLGLAFVIVLVHLAAASLFGEFKTELASADSPVPATVARVRVRLPADVGRIPRPILQANELADLERLRQAEERRLTSYGWVDAKVGVVHIPIAEAMRLLADPKTAAKHGLRVKSDFKKGDPR